jgi:anthraniloyl-CoA monooxygenase
MRVAVLGGGPGGLYFAISLKLRDPSHEIVVIERNRSGDTFGWGVVLSDETLENIEANDPKSAATIRGSFAYWDDIAVFYRGTVVRSGGHGFCGIARKRLLNILQDRAHELGVVIRFETEAGDPETYRRDYDLVVGADGINSRVRATYADKFKADIDVRACKYIWLGTHQKFDDAFTFIFEHTEAGWIWAHAYQFDADTATFIVECSESTWRNAGFDQMTTEQTIAACEKIFARNLGGNALMSNARHLRGSAWLNFNRVLCEHWSFDNVVLLGDAAATAHFSVGSGSKLAMESAIALASYLASGHDMEQAFRRYEDERRLEVLRLQNAARNSSEWFEQADRYFNLDPIQFNYSLLTRSQRISHENLRQRDPEWLAGAEKWFEERATGRRPNVSRPPMFVPLKVRDVKLANRVCVSPMAQYRAVDGLPNDWHFVHYAERAKGGAGLVFTEMTCVSAQGRISPGCTGLYDESHERAWKRLVDFVHAETEAKIAIQLGHSGIKGSTQLGWETSDAPLLKNNWEVIGPSRVPWSPENQTPREMTREDMDKVRDAFVHSAEMAVRVGFDWLELHYAHGYLMSSFITPLTNRRTDEYGGSLENRMRFPLDVFRAVRKIWPEDKPISVRISAHDWVGQNGIMPQDAVSISRMLADNGVDLIDVSAGQTTIDAKPVYGRMFQTPFSDRIRNETGVATLAVGNIYEPDHVNSILMAGRADLVCLGRPHLANPYWALHAAADLRYMGVHWPKPYLRGGEQLNRLTARAEAITGKA